MRDPVGVRGLNIDFGMTLRDARWANSDFRVLFRASTFRWLTPADRERFCVLLATPGFGIGQLQAIFGFYGSARLEALRWPLEGYTGLGADNLASVTESDCEGILRALLEMRPHWRRALPWPVMVWLRGSTESSQVLGQRYLVSARRITAWRERMGGQLL